jgi:hypothetical protein
MLYFWSIFFQILGLLTIIRASLGLQWDSLKLLPPNVQTIVYIAMGSSIFDMIVMWFYMTHMISRLWTYWLNISQGVRIIMLSFAVAIFKTSTLNGYYALWETIAFIFISLFLRITDYSINGSSVGRIRLSIQERQILVSMFLTFVAMTIGAIVFMFVEEWTFENAFIFVNVTALTIGYGNLIPTTTAGKLIIITVGNILLLLAGYFVFLVKDWMSPGRIRQRRNIIFFFTLLIIYIIFGATVFMFLEEWSFLDAVFFTWYTVNTVGYGSITPSNPLSWEFWIYFVYLSVSFYAFGLGLLNNMMLIAVHKRTLNLQDNGNLYDEDNNENNGENNGNNNIQNEVVML